MRILVTGSGGFIGKRLAAELRKKGHSVEEFDLDNGLDLLKEADCKKAVKGMDAVVHLAAVLDESSPLLWKVNVEGTENMVKAAAEAKVDRFIHLSTVGVHGRQQGIVMESTPFNPVTNYEKSKAEAEGKVQEFQEMIHITILRPAIVLGPNEYWQKIIGLMERDFPLIGNGKNKWQTVYVQDLVGAIVFCAEKEKTKDETFIVAEEKALSLEQVCVELKKALGLEPRVKKIPYWIGKILAYFYITFLGKSIVSPAHLERLRRNREYSIAKIKKFGWHPKWDAKRGIAETVEALKG